jgi:hypothetical protein
MARVAAFVDDLFFAAKVQETLRAAGHEVEVVPAGGSPGQPVDVAVVDLHGAQAALPEGVPVLAFYSHVDTDARQRGEEAGHELVVPRSRMAREMPALVERLVAG